MHPPRLNGLSIANVAASSHSYDLNSRRRGQALAGVAFRRRQKKYASPQSTPVAAPHPHAEELCPHFPRQPKVQRFPCPLPLSAIPEPPPASSPLFHFP